MCGNERLTSLALMHIHRDILVYSQEMVDKFARLHPTPQADEHVTLRRHSVHSMIANQSATLFISNLGPCISNISQFKTYCFLFISNDLHNCFTTDGSDRRLQLSVTSNGGLMIELRMSTV